MEDIKMGFFTDLKEDLSQAVNELIPEEEGGKPETARSVMETARELVPAEDELASGRRKKTGRMKAGQMHLRMKI